jgi:hypothetical protein
MRARRGLWDRERHRLPALRAPIEYVVFSVDQLDKHLVLTGRQTRHADCIVVTRFHPTPRQVVDVYVQMPDPLRYVERACPEHWYDMTPLFRFDRYMPRASVEIAKNSKRKED